VLFMNKINLIEVYYATWRKTGKDTADQILHMILSSPITVIDALHDEGIIRSGPSQDHLSHFVGRRHRFGRSPDPWRKACHSRRPRVRRDPRRRLGVPLDSVGQASRHIVRPSGRWRKYAGRRTTEWSDRRRVGEATRTPPCSNGIFGGFHFVSPTLQTTGSNRGGIMKIRASLFIGLIAIFIALAGSANATAGDSKAAVQQFQKGPSVFIENQGQWADESIRFALDVPEPMSA